MSKKENKIMVSFRLSPTTIDHLEKLCLMSGSSKGELISELINNQFDKVNGNPDLKDLLQKLKLIEDTLKGIEKT